MRTAEIVTSCDQPGNPHHLTVALRLAALAWLAMTLQEVLLYARPDPYGEPYVGIWYGYLAYALAYNLLGVMLVSAPMLALWLWLMILFWLTIARAERRVADLSDTNHYGIVLGTLGALTGFLMSSLVNYNYGDAEVAMMFWFLMGATVKPSRHSTERGSAGSKSRCGRVSWI